MIYVKQGFNLTTQPQLKDNNRLFSRLEEITLFFPSVMLFPSSPAVHLQVMYYAQIMLNSGVQTTIQQCSN